jgi:hypothetical protein
MRQRILRGGLFAILGLLALGLAAACDGDDDSPTPPPGGERREVEAPVESFDLLILESFPPQYNVEIVSGLPNGCHRFERYEVERDGSATDIKITVWNTIPVGDDIACDQSYGTHTGTATLGSDFESGTEYTLTVGDKTETFVAQ